MKFLRIRINTIILAVFGLSIPYVVVADGDHTLISPDNVAVTLQQAMDIALQQVPGNVIATELENEDGLVVWEITVMKQDSATVELQIDGTSGSIVVDDEEEDDDD